MTRALVPALPVVCVLFAAACGYASGPTQAPEACGRGRGDSGGAVVVALFDVSRSTRADEIRERYLGGLGRVLAPLGAGGGALVALAPVNRDSYRDFDPTECSFPAKDRNANDLRFETEAGAAREQAVQVATAIIDGPRGRKGTAILEALDTAGRYLANHGEAEHRYLVLFSDMVEESERLTMTRRVLTPSGTARFIARQRSRTSFPTLNGVDVYVVGAGVSSTAGRGKLDREAIEGFWLRYLRAAGARIDPSDYGPSLTVFP